MTDLTALIERIESGTGSDRALDLAICCAVLDATKHKGWWDFQATRPRDEPEKPASEFWKRFGPSYTSSLDSVLSLIEAKLPGMSWEVRRSGFGTPSQAMIWDPMKSPPVSTIARISVETSPARALLAAALRAIQESRNDR